MPRCEDQGLAYTPPGRRDPRVRQRAEGGGHTGQDTKGHARLRQGQCLFAAAAEDVRIAALEPQNPRALLREGDEKRVDLGLRFRMRATPFTDVVKCRAVRRAQHRGIDERIVDDGIRCAERCHDLQCQAAGAARPGAGEPDVSRREIRQRRLEAANCRLKRRAVQIPARPRKRRWYPAS